MRETLECLFPLLQAQLTHRQGDRPAAWQHHIDCARRFKIFGSSTPECAAPSHLWYLLRAAQRDTARRCTLGLTMRDAGASYTDVPKEQNAYPISRSGHSTSSVPWSSLFIEITQSIFTWCSTWCSRRPLANRMPHASISAAVPR